MLFHPGPAKIDCAECVKFVFDLQAGEKSLYWGRDDAGERVQLPQIRPPGSTMPCGNCPKKSPEHAKEFELTPQNVKAWRWWLEARATGLTDAEKSDAIVRRNFGILEAIWAEWQRKRQAEATAIELGKLFVR